MTFCPRNTETQRLDIQGLRAIAVIMVVAFHAGFLATSGFTGVDVFFVISGFVITRMLHREWSAPAEIDFRRFYLRRFKRLTPALAAMAGIVIILSYLLLSPFGTQQTTAKTALGALLLGANIIIARTTGGYFDAPAQLNPLLNTWTLSVEEQFYIVFPVLIIAGWRLKASSPDKNKHAPLSIIAIVLAISFGLTIIHSFNFFYFSESPVLGFYSPFVRGWEFAAGALLALSPRRFTLLSSRHALPLAVLGVAMLIASSFLLSANDFPGVLTLLPVAGATLVIMAGEEKSNVITRILSKKPITKIGDWSYSIYLWHWPLIVFASVLWPTTTWAPSVAAIFSLLPAVASYKWIEQPIREMPTTITRQLVIWTSAIILPAFGVAVLTLEAEKLGLFPHDVEIAVADVLALHAPSQRGCFTAGPYTSALVGQCGWNLGAKGPPIYLVGDSDAWQFSEAVITAGKQLNRPVWILTAPSCAMIVGMRISRVGDSRYFNGPQNGNEWAHCPSYVAYTMEWLRRATPGTVIIAMLDQKWWDPSVRIELAHSRSSTSPSEKASVLEKGLIDTITLIERSAHHVILVQSIPTYRNPRPIWDPRMCSFLAIRRGNCSRETPERFIDNLQRLSRAAFANAARETNSSVLDLREWLCDSQVCSTKKDGVNLYSDATHLTVSASAGLAPKFVAVLTARQPPRGMVTDPGGQ